jgi:predicted MFS family arabinose efflux permease
MYGAVYKLFNVKLAYLGAIFIFEIGSLICAVAPDSTTFIVGRAIAGVSLLLFYLIHGKACFLTDGA